MHDKFAELIINNIPNLDSLVEIGAGNGILSLSMFNIKNDINYNIIDPYYFGIKENRNIISDYIENIKNIEYVCLCFPDLEIYIKNNTYNVLTPEHTYYIENNFLKQIFLKNGFETIIEEKFKEHSIFLIFKRTSVLNNDIIPKNENSIIDIKNYYDSIFKKINKLNNILSITNNNIDAYIFPCSIHTLYLFAFGLNTTYF
jgi:hypothetical protein